MRCAALLVFGLLLMSPAQAQSPKVWFTNRDCGALEIKKHRSISKHEVVASVKLDDVALVRRLVDRIEKIPPDGAEMIDFGPDAEHVDLVFQCGTGTRTIEIYNKHVKTPSTGFHGTNPIETELYTDLDGLLAPDFGKRILKAPGLAAAYKGFTVTYVGKLTSDGAPATVSSTTETYEVKDRRGGVQRLEIVSGQMPPGPRGFVVDNKKLRLLTYEGSRGGRLYPDYFEIAR